MSRYIDADRLRAEIERRVYDDYNTGEHEIDDIAQGALAGLIPFIDSLQQEQPEVDLGEEIDSFYRHEPCVGDLGYYDFRAIAEHFYELGKEGQR